MSHKTHGRPLSTPYTTGYKEKDVFATWYQDPNTELIRSNSPNSKGIDQGNTMSPTSTATNAAAQAEAERLKKRKAVTDDGFVIRKTILG
jgi:hypothetical protein